MERLVWMYDLSRLDPSYILEVQKFIDAPKNQAWRTKKTTHIHCPCIDCRNMVLFDDTQQILSHLVCRGFMKDYLIWTKHGEGSFVPYATINPTNIDVDGPLLTSNMLCQMFQIMVPLEEMKAAELI